MYCHYFSNSFICKMSVPATCVCICVLSFNSRHDPAVWQCRTTTLKSVRVHACMCVQRAYYVVWPLHLKLSVYVLSSHLLVLWYCIAIISKNNVLYSFISGDTVVQCSHLKLGMCVYFICSYLVMPLCVCCIASCLELAHSID